MASVAQLQTIDDGQGFIELLVLEHESFGQVYLVNDSQNWIIDGNTYIALPFRIKLPSNLQNENPRAQLQIDNVGRELSVILESLPVGGSITAIISVASRATPYINEYEFVSQLSGIALNTSVMTATMGPDDTMRQTSVRIRFDPSTTPGLFQG